VVDATGVRILAANPAALRLYDHTLPEMLGTYGDLSGDSAAWQGHVRRKDSACPWRLPGVTGDAARSFSALLEDAEQELRSNVMEMVAGNQPLEPILFHINELFERRCPTLRPAVLLLREGRLHHVVADRVPAALRQSLDGLPIGASDSPASPYRPLGEPETEVDIANDSRWEPWCDIAMAEGLHCCWCRPLRPARGNLGVYAVY
jgi:hypothetical protein